MPTAIKAQPIAPTTTAADAAAVVANIETKRAEITNRLAELDTKVADAALKAVADASDKSYANLSMELANARLELQRLDHALVAAKRIHDELHRAEQIRNRQAQCKRVEKMLATSDEVAKRLEASIANTIADFRELVELRRKAFTAAPATIDQAGTFSTFAKVRELVEFELYRQGAVPMRLSAEIPIGEQNFPGGVSPTITLRSQPHLIEPLSKKLADANAYILRKIHGALPDTPAPVEDEPASVFRNNGLATR